MKMRRVVPGIGSMFVVNLRKKPAMIDAKARQRRLQLQDKDKC